LELPFEEERNNDEMYNRWNLIKDVNYINNLHNHVLTMLSAGYPRDCKTKGQSTYQIVKTTNSIERLII